MHWFAVFMEGQVAGNVTLAHPNLVAAFRSVDVFTLNENEALRISGEN